MTYSNITVSNQEPQREFFDCPNCWGYQEYKSEARSEVISPAESRYNGYVHMRTNFNHLPGQSKEQKS